MVRLGPDSSGGLGEVHRRAARAADDLDHVPPVLTGREVVFLAHLQVGVGVDALGVLAVAELLGPDTGTLPAVAVVERLAVGRGERGLRRRVEVPADLDRRDLVVADPDDVVVGVAAVADREVALAVLGTGAHELGLEGRAGLVLELDDHVEAVAPRRVHRLLHVVEGGDGRTERLGADHVSLLALGVARVCFPNTTGK